MPSIMNDCPALAIPTANPTQEPDSPRAPVILVIGERFTDRYFIGTATRLSPEAVVPVVAIKEVIQSPGGAANVAENLKALGATVREIYQPGHYPIKNRLVANGQQLARWDVDDYIAPFDSFKLRLLAPQFRGVDGVIISDYAKGAFTPEAISTIRKLVPSDTPLFVDTKGSPAWFGGSPFFFPNMKEWATHKVAYDEESLVIRTESENGMTLLEDGVVLHHLPTLATKVVSVSGAGDTAIAAFAYAIGCGKHVSQAMEFASQACAISVSKPYTSTVTLDEIKNTFR